MRQSSIDQLRRINNEIRKQGGDIADKVKKGEKHKEEKMPNDLWMDNPLDRTVDSVEDHMTIDIPNHSQHKGVSEKITKFDNFKNKINEMKFNEEILHPDDKKQPIKEKVEKIQRFATFEAKKIKDKDVDVEVKDKKDKKEIDVEVKNPKGKKVEVEVEVDNKKDDKKDDKPKFGSPEWFAKYPKKGKKKKSKKVNEDASIESIVVQFMNEYEGIVDGCYLDGDDLIIMIEDVDEGEGILPDTYMGKNVIIKDSGGKFVTFDEGDQDRLIDLPIGEFDMESDTFEGLNENTDNDNYYDIMRNMNTIKNWDAFTNKRTLPTREILRGRQVTVGDVSGFVNRIDGKDVYLDTHEGEKIVSIKEISNAYKPIKTETELPKTNIQGPANKSVSKPVKGSGKGVASDVTDTAKSAKLTQDIIKKTQGVNQIKKLSDMGGPYTKDVKGQSYKAPKTDLTGPDQTNTGIKSNQRKSDLIGPNEN